MLCVTRFVRDASGWGGEKFPRFSPCVATALHLSRLTRLPRKHSLPSHMPSLSTPAGLPPSDINPVGVSARRSASRKQASSVANTAGNVPLVTRAAYDALLQGKGDPAMALAVRRLCAVKAQLATALLLLDSALHSYNPQINSTPAEQESKAPIYNALRGMRERIEREWKGVPLEVRA